MNKRTQIILILAISLILLLGLTIPSLASQGGYKHNCFINVIATNRAGVTFGTEIKLYGELDAYNWEGDTLHNYCTGVIPFGEDINPGLTYAGFQAWCDLPFGECNGVSYYLENNDGNFIVYDPDTDITYFGTYAEFTLSDTGAFVFHKEYSE